MKPHRIPFFAAVAALALVAVSLPAQAADTTADLEPVGSRPAAEQRTDPDPALTTGTAERPPATTIPADRYDMAGR